MKYFVSFFILLTALGVQAQSIDEARRLLRNGDFGAALPLFEAIAHASSARMAALKPEAFRALGDIYYQNYAFEQSAAAYRQSGASDAVALAERSERAARLLSRCEDIQLVDSVIVDKAAFLSAYRLSDDAGRLVPEMGGVAYENPLGNRRYFAEGTPQGKRLFVENRVQGRWDDRMEIGVPADSLADNDFPFVLPDGLTVYYASNNRSSIGGYDLFITRYHLNNNTWLAPTQLGMPFNSIADDYLLAVDEEKRIGYFATNRFQPEDKVIVYTFIPNEAVTPLENTDKAALVRRARIASIRDSWKPGVDYADYLSKIRRTMRDEHMTPVREFVFAVDDETVYYTLNDFRTDAAKQAFLKARETGGAIGHLEAELDALRLEYAQSGAGKKRSLSPAILSKETRLEDLYRQRLRFEKSARAAEIRYYRKNTSEFTNKYK